mgnify:CR=1 FL=1
MDLELHHFGYLINKKKLEEEDAFEDFVNYDSVGGGWRVLPSGACKLCGRTYLWLTGRQTAMQISSRVVCVVSCDTRVRRSRHRCGATLSYHMPA